MMKRILSTVSAIVSVAAAGTLTAGPALPPLDGKAERAWSAYAGSTERRIHREIQAGVPFLGLDFDRSAAEVRRQLLRGETVVREMPAATENDRRLEVPDAMVHHWRGAVLLRGAKLDDVVRRLKAEPPRADNQDVLASSILEQRGDEMRVAIKVQRIRFVRVVYNTEHAVAFTRHTATRASSRSMATKIAELTEPGTRSEREVGSGEDRGFLRRWHSYWRYEQVAEGVIAECESVSLSRPVPWGLGFMVGRLIDSTARQSMERALAGVRAHLESR